MVPLCTTGHVEVTNMDHVNLLFWTPLLNWLVDTYKINLAVRPLNFISSFDCYIFALFKIMSLILFCFDKRRTFVGYGKVVTLGIQNIWYCSIHQVNLSRIINGWILFSVSIISNISFFYLLNKWCMWSIL